LHLSYGSFNPKQIVDFRSPSPLQSWNMFLFVLTEILPLK